MENRSHALIAGVFSVIFVLALIMAAMWLTGRGERQLIYDLVSTGSVKGLDARATVRFRGVEVGKVQSIDFDPKQPKAIIIRIAINPDTPVTRGTYAQLLYQGVTGVVYVALNDEGTHEVPLPTNADRPARIPVKPSELEEVGETAKQALAHFNEIAIRANTLLGDENQGNIAKSLANVQAATANLVKLTNAMQPTLKALPGLTAQTQATMQHTNVLIGDMDKLARSLNAKTGDLDEMAKGVVQLTRTGSTVGRAVATQTLPKVDETLSSLDKTSRNLNDLGSELKSHPQSLLFGHHDNAPDPGEPGFSPGR
jgi:phospholipid/cholesterol/gamma-HCH transport system substrate-binding protein